MRLRRGSQLGHYTVVDLLGTGGMGEVYRATDSRLRREVALKVLRPGEHNDTDKRRRFQREARAASALNHPNITSIYDVGEEEIGPYIVYELVEGQALRDVLKNEVLGIPELLDLTSQVAAGLAVAHEAGIVHRDLKPENIMITREGQVKILDFGLARTAPGQPVSETDSTSTQLATKAGVILGTVGYMSPEQARGETVDHRSDQFSFGLVVYEMASGRRAFEESSVTELLASIIRDDPESLASVNPKLPPQFRWIVERCLSKKSADRYASTTDLYRELQTLKDRLPETASGEILIASEQANPSRFGLLLLALLTVVCLVFFLGSRSELDLTGYELRPFATEAGAEMTPAFSPDGNMLAYAAEIDGVRQILARSLEGSSTAQLTDAESHCSSPFWPPDGTRVYFHRDSDIWSVSVAGGSPQLVLENASAARVTPDGKELIFFRQTNGVDGLWMYSLEGEDLRQYQKSPFPTSFRGMSSAGLSPDGTKLGVLLTNSETNRPEFWIIPWRLGEPYVGLAVALKGELEAFPSWTPDSRHVIFSTGLKVHIGDTDDDTARTILATTDFMMAPVVSPDGDRIAFASGGPDFDLVEVFVDGSGLRSLLATSQYERGTSWMPSADEYAYVASSGPTLGIWFRRLGQVWGRPFEPLDPATEIRQSFRWMPSVSPDGRRLAYTLQAGDSRICVAPVTGGKSVCLNSEADHHYWHFAWSPDGDWIAYIRIGGAGHELVRIRSGGEGPVEVIAEVPPMGVDTRIDWSKTGEWMCFGNEEGLHLIKADGSGYRRLTDSGSSSFGFVRNGRALCVVRRGSDRRWELVEFSLPDGNERAVTKLDLPVSAQVIDFNLHPTGDRFATSVGRNDYDIWLLEGFLK